MLERVLVGLDGSDASRAALAWAADLTRRCGLELAVARVADDDATGAAHDELAGWCGETLGGEVPASLHVRPGDASAALPALAQELEADLLVVGERGSSGLVTVHLGSVAHALARRTPLPLGLVPPDAQPEAEHFVVGVDGSPASEHALALVTALARRLEVAVTAVHVTEPLDATAGPTDWREQAHARVAEWIEPARRADVEVSIEIAPDYDPATAIARVAESHAGAVAVIGDAGRLARLPLRLAHHTSAPVLLVPPPPDA